MNKKGKWCSSSGARRPLVKVKLDSSGNVAHYNYDGGGARVRKVISRNGRKQKERLYLGILERYREYDNAGVVKVERWTLQVEGETLTVDSGQAVVSPVPTIRYQYREHLGSSTVEANENGQMISYEEYYPYGASAYRAAAFGVDLSLKRYRFTGKERDEETGLDYFGVRHYASWLGRWTSGDPGGFVDGLNWYRYVRNNPVNGIDREGYSTEEVEPPPVDPVYKGKNQLITLEDGTVIESSISEENIATITADRPPIEEITTGSFFGDLLLGEIPIVGTVVDLYNAYAGFQNGDYLGAGLNALSAIPLLGAAAKVGKKAWKAVSPYVDDFIEGHKQIGRDISSAWENTKDLFRRGGGTPPPALQGAGGNIPVDVPNTPTPKKVEPQKPQQQKMEGDGPGGGDPPKKSNKNEGIDKGSDGKQVNPSKRLEPVTEKFDGLIKRAQDARKMSVDEYKTKFKYLETISKNSPVNIGDVSDRLKEMLTDRYRIVINDTSTIIESLDNKFLIRITNNQVGANLSNPRIHISKGKSGGHASDLFLAPRTTRDDIVNLFRRR